MRSIRKYILSSVNTTGYVLTQSVNGRWFIFMGTMVAEFITIITRRIHALYANWDGGFTHYFRKNNDIQWRFSNKHMIVYRDPAEKCEEYIVYTVSELYKILFELRKDMQSTMRRLGVYKYGKPNREDDEVIGMLDAHTVYMNYAFVGSCLWSYTFDERGECTAKTSLTNDLSVFFAEDNTCINDRPNKVSYEFYDLHTLARVLYVIYSCE